MLSLLLTWARLAVSNSSNNRPARVKPWCHESWNGRICIIVAPRWFPSSPKRLTCVALRRHPFHPFDILNVSLGACRSRWTQGIDLMRRLSVLSSADHPVNLRLRPPSPCASVWLCGWWECGCCSRRNKKESNWMLDKFGFVFFPELWMLAACCIAAKVVFGGINVCLQMVTLVVLIWLLPIYQEEIVQWYVITMYTVHRIPVNT